MLLRGWAGGGACGVELLLRLPRVLDTVVETMVREAVVGPKTVGRGAVGSAWSCRAPRERTAATVMVRRRVGRDIGSTSDFVNLRRA